MTGGERDGNLLGLESLNAAANSAIGGRQIDGVAAQAEVEGHRHRLEGAVQGGRNPGLDGNNHKKKQCYGSECRNRERP